MKNKREKAVKRVKTKTSKLPMKALEKPKEKSPTKWLIVSFVFGVASILLVTLLIVTIAEFLFVTFGLSGKEEMENSGEFWIFIVSLVSLAIGLGLAYVFSKIILKPINSVLDGMQKLCEGEFSTRIDLGKKSMYKGVEKKFNLLASELENTEILRSDFVNDFSHELKTPIASVSSLIKLMKNDDLPAEKRKKYLEIIEEEINRIAGMTTNILNLSKIENQDILTGKAEFNVSEQIRTCVLMLEKAWSKKSLNPILDFEEINITANEDMLKQVWINLLDNAIKFSHDNTDLTVLATVCDDKISVSITNVGDGINEEDKSKIFNKFYRGNAHAKEGNGIGLSIVKHIVDLHFGNITVYSENGITTFTVTLPIK